MLVRMSWRIWFAFTFNTRFLRSLMSSSLTDQLVKAKEQQEKDYVDNIKTKKSAKAKVCHTSSFLAGSIFFRI